MSHKKDGGSSGWSQSTMAVSDNQSFCWLLPQRQRRDGDEAHYEIIVTSDDFISLADNIL
jgi:hypothetical protein